MAKEKNPITSDGLALKRGDTFKGMKVFPVKADIKGMQKATKGKGEK